MHTHYQGFFNIGSAAWTRSKGYQRWKIQSIAVNQFIHTIGNIINQLVCISHANMHGCIDTYGSATGLSTTKQQRTGSCN
jgi:hypothetical protein